MLLCVICEPFLGERDLFFFEGADNIIYLTDLKKKINNDFWYTIQIIIIFGAAVSKYIFNAKIPTQILNTFSLTLLQQIRC